ncbi:hypothetical protein DYB32_009696, partial [Aphanomyces invadans]
MQSTYASAAHSLHEEAPSDEILAAFELLKKQRTAVEDKRMQVALSLESLRDDDRRRKVAEDAPPREFA